MPKLADFTFQTLSLVSELISYVLPAIDSGIWLEMAEQLLLRVWSSEPVIWDDTDDDMWSRKNRSDLIPNKGVTRFLNLLKYLLNLRLNSVGAAIV